MFSITKNARIHESVASEKYSKADIANMVREGGGSRYFAFPFECDVIGCVQPSDNDPDNRFRAERDPDYDVSELVSDVETLADKHGVDLLVNAINRGVDLELRAKARPKPRAKMSDADKVAYLFVHHADKIADFGGDLAAAARWYDENVA